MTAAAVVTDPAPRGRDARDRVLDAAVELFAEQGYDATSVAQVITRAGLTKGGFYHHFDSKEALLFEVYGDLISRQLANLDRILATGAPPGQTLRAIVVDLVETTAASSRRAMVFWRELHRLGGERTAEYRQARRRYHDAVRDLIAAGQRDGVFSSVASADVVTFTIFGVVNELPLWFRPDGRRTAREIADELADLVAAALRPAPAPDSSGPAPFEPDASAPEPSDHAPPD